jgi:hypothetical protein
MAIQAHTQCTPVLETPALAMNWTMEQGRLRCRWVMASQRKPSWLDCPDNPAESTESTVVRPFYFHVLAKLVWLMNLFC